MNDSALTASEVARQMLKRSPAWFYAHRAQLEAVDFPKPLPILNKYSRAAVQAWLDMKMGHAPKSGSGLAERFGGGRDSGEGRAA